MFKGILCPSLKKNIDSPELSMCQNCKKPCMPYPVLKALISEKEFLPDTFHVTELTNYPIRMAYLRRKYNYYVSIESLINLAIGTAFHELIASKKNQCPSYFSFEESNHFEIQIRNKKVSGTPDLYNSKNKILYDYKVVRVSEAERLLTNIKDSLYIYQLNAYRVYKFPDAKQLILNLIIKDFTLSTPFITKVNFPIIPVSVPLLNPKIIKNFIESKVDQLSFLLDNPKAECPLCTIEERWNGKRCSFYCDVHMFCKKEGKKQWEGVAKAED